MSAKTWRRRKRKAATNPGSPAEIIPLYGYQKRFIEDRCRLKGWVKSRQVGGSFTCTLDMVLDAIAGGGDWNTMSRTGRQAKKLLRKAADHVAAVDAYVRNKLRQPTIVEKITSEEIVLSNGAILSALPCDPDTTVGDTCNWLLDEWALHPNSQTTFGTIKPSIMHGKRLMGVSSPRGRRGKFAELFHQWKDIGADSGWSWHVVTIEDAMRDGLTLYDHLGRPLSFEDFRKQEIRDIGMEMWLQEYMCGFMDSVTAFLAYDTIQACQIAGRPLQQSPEQLRRAGRELYVGVDIGRRHDLTVIWILSVAGDGSFVTEAAIPLEKTAFRTQEGILRGYLDTGLVTRCCIDCMGVGMQLAETFATDYAGVVEPVTFTVQSKLAMAERLRIQMESGNFTMPANEDVEEDFYGVEKVVTDSDVIRIAANRSGKTHGDYFWAAALALKGAAEFGGRELALAAA